jgi:hypothetical protein
MPSSGMWRRVDLVWTDVSEERIASLFRIEKSVSEEPAWAGGRLRVTEQSRKEHGSIYSTMYKIIVEYTHRMTPLGESRFRLRGYSYVFVVSLTTLSAYPKIQRGMIG